MKARILVVEDEPVIAQDIAFNLEDNGFELSGIAHTSEKALDILFQKNTDCILLDINIKGTKNGIELATIINDKYKLPFIFLTSFNDEDTVKKAAATLPFGYIVKPFKDADLSPVIVTALAKYKSIHNQNEFSIEHLSKIYNQKLSKTEIQVLYLLLKGFTNQQIADESFVSINTVKTHVSNVFLKFDVHSKLQLIQKLK